MIIRTTSTQTHPGKEQWGVPRSPQHPRRLPWKSVHCPILLPGLPEEILEGSYNAALPVPEGSPSTEKARQADSTSQPRGDTDPPPSTSLSSPPRARFPPGCWPAAPLCIKNTELHYEQWVDCPGPHWRQRHGHSCCSLGEMLSWRMSLCTLWIPIAACFTSW